MTSASDEQCIARDMIAVHGTEAAAVARSNARAAALAGQRAGAQAWIRVLGIIQLRHTASRHPPQPAGGELPAQPNPDQTQG